MRAVTRSILLLVAGLCLAACAAGGKQKASVSADTSPIAHVFDFSEGLALIVSEDGKYGYMDYERQVVIPPTYDYAASFHEGMAVVGVADEQGQLVYHVISPQGETLFGIALDSCVLASEYQDGLLWYHDMRTGHEGWLDRKGRPTSKASEAVSVADEHQARGLRAEASELTKAEQMGDGANADNGRAATTFIASQDWRKVSAANPFYAEARKVLSGRLAEHDAAHRTMILNYVEHLRTSYTTKDVDFLEQLFSDEALIIVGHVVRAASATEVPLPPRVRYNVVTKQQYLARLRQVFASNQRVDVQFSDFLIKRHPTVEGIYGVTLRQGYRADSYQDDGWLFLLWDFRDETAPKIHVRTWQAATTEGGVLPHDSVFGIHDFNLR